MLQLIELHPDDNEGGNEGKEGATGIYDYRDKRVILEMNDLEEISEKKEHGDSTPGMFVKES